MERLSAAEYFRSAVSALRLPSDQRLFAHATGGLDQHALIDQVLALPRRELEQIALDTGRNLVNHPLNAAGLRVLRAQLARRVTDRARERRGWASHPLYKSYEHHGFLAVRLRNFDPARPHATFTLDDDELDLMRMATAYAEPYTACRHAGKAACLLNTYYLQPFSHIRKFTTNASLIVRPRRAPHVYDNGDPQYQTHQDMISPIFKFFIFVENVTLANGPFFIVPGSHHASAAKLRWLWDRTRHLNMSRMPAGSAANAAEHTYGALRHVNLGAEGPTPQCELTRNCPCGSACPPPGTGEGWCHKSTACLEAAYFGQQQHMQAEYGFAPPLPVTVEAGTLIIADTSALHWRGYQRARTRRALQADLLQASTGFEIVVSTRQLGMCAVGSTDEC